MAAKVIVIKSSDYAFVNIGISSGEHICAVSCSDVATATNVDNHC